MNTLIFLLLLFITPHKIEDKIKEPNTCNVYNDSEKSQFTLITKEESPLEFTFETRVVYVRAENKFYLYGYCSKHEEFLLVGYKDNEEKKYYYNPAFLK